ncbi:Plant transposase (Ptta/En/Spm family) [Carex littledalei]|uniref:Plant transposase (Ptta/En/Spm family) n=1 Tax=Carex littledalei TaxID=544730 RepID=A0A833QYY9_9POAL|nr:Plant transposase (Ptta/En/Spm family) [Carex littledalei]
MEPEQLSDTQTNGTDEDGTQFLVVQRRKSPRLNPSPSMTAPNQIKPLSPPPPPPPPPQPQPQPQPQQHIATSNRNHNLRLKPRSTQSSCHRLTQILVHRPRRKEKLTSLAILESVTSAPPRAKSRTRAISADESPTDAETVADAQPTLAETAAAQSTRAEAADESPTDAETVADAQPTLAETAAAAQSTLAETADEEPTDAETPADAEPTLAETAAAAQSTLAETASAQSTRAEAADESPTDAETVADAQPTLAETAAAQSTRAETAADASPTYAAAQHAAHSPTDAETAAAQSGDSSPRSDTDWSPSRSETASQPQSGDSSPCAHTEGLYTDDGRIRCRNRRTLRSCPESWKACGRELDESAAQESAEKKKRKRNKGKSDVRCGRGLAKPRAPVQPAGRPYLMVVGDAEFTSSPFCTKVITTIRVLTLENLPGPYRSYNMFPSQIRLVILQQFLQRYSWGPKEDIGRCLDVFEKIAAESYMRELNETRQQLTKKYGDDKEKWKDFPPKWCKNIEAWKGLCDVWSTKNWDQQSATNRSNRTSKENEVHHVTGSKSMFRHKQALMREKGDSVGLKDVFDKTHMRNTPEGKVYLTRRAKEAAERFDALKGKYGEQMEEDQIWEKAVEGEDARGRLFGFGFRGRTSKSTRVLETVEASPSGPTRSTATSAADANRSFSNVEVAQLLAAERTQFANEIAAQDRRHRAEMDSLHKHHEYTRACFDALFRAGGLRPPPEPSSEANADGGHKGSGGHPNPAEGNSGGGDKNEPSRATSGGEMGGS